MILGTEIGDIVKLAVDYHSELCDGVTQYDYDNGKICGAGFTTGETENPLNHLIEIFRLPQGEMGEINMRCYDCPYEDEEYLNKVRAENPQLYSSKEECCVNAYIDELFEEDFQVNYKNGVECEVRNVLSDFLGETLDKLDTIRIGCSDIATPYKYLEVRQDNWKYDVLDAYVDNAMLNGFNITDCSPVEFLDAEVQFIIGYEYSDNPLLQSIAKLVQDGNLDGAIKLLHDI